MTWFFIGLIAGGVFAFFIFSLCCISSDSDKDLEEIMKNKK